MPVSRTSKFVAGGAIAVSLALAFLFGYTAHERPLTSLESFVLQFLAILIGLAGSYLFGLQASEKIVRVRMKPHIRSAFRRLLSLYDSLRQVAIIAEGSPSGDAERKLDMIRVIADVQTRTADDALEDWADIDSESVEALRLRLGSESARGDENG